jgi:UDP-N-acetylglucosamine--N-acetylmuramyl-(pentapeptide) pyrophosphoryl-undecaprenol N-acetylglucosamine transferase
MTNFKSSADALTGANKVVCVGNPTLFEINTDIKAVDKKDDGFARHVVSFGGSGGAENLNAQMCKVIAKLAPLFPDTEFYHAAGKRDFENTHANFEQNGLLNMKNVKLVDYIYDMNERMSGADLLICRAGAMTVSELALMGKAAIFVPSPYVAANHQYKNAKAIYDADACELVEEREFDSGRLEDTVSALLENDGRRHTMENNIKAFAVCDANEKIYAEIISLIG